MKPTPQDVLDLLPIVANRGWKINKSGRIRDKDGRCPLAALAHELSGGEVNYQQAGYTAISDWQGSWEMGDLKIYKPIYDAADFPKHPLRPALLEALGV